MKRILIIDDDPVFGRIYESLFQGEGYVVDLAGEPEDAIERLKATPPDLVLLDLFLRKANGVQVLKFIRSRPTTHALPVIVLSNASTSRLVDAAWRAGADRFLAKDDFDPEQLIEIVRTTLATPHPLAAPVSNLADGAARDGLIGLNPPQPAAAVEPLNPRLVGFNHQLDELLCDFVKRVRSSERSLRAMFDEFIKTNSDGVRMARLEAMWKTFGIVGREARMLGQHRLARLCNGVCIFFKDLEEEPHYINAMSSQTINRAIDGLLQLLDNDRNAEEAPFNYGILVVDDEVLSRWAIVSAMEMAGLRTLAAEDSRLAMTLIEENRFDLILLDWHLPVVNGIELCARIRESHTNRSTPIIFVTVRTDLESRVKSSLSGADDFMTKPFLFSELAVRALLSLLTRRDRAGGLS